MSADGRCNLGAGGRRFKSDRPDHPRLPPRRHAQNESRPPVSGHRLTSRISRAAGLSGAGWVRESFCETAPVLLTDPDRGRIGP
jgi:hypothetical protein